MPRGPAPPPIGKGTGLVTLSSALPRLSLEEWALPNFTLGTAAHPPRQAEGTGLPRLSPWFWRLSCSQTCLSLRAGLSSSYPFYRWKNGGREPFLNLLRFSQKPEI